VNVYTKMGYADTLIVLLLLIAFIAGEVWIMSLFPKLNPYALHGAMIFAFVVTLRWAAKRKKEPGRKHLIDPVTGKPHQR